MTDPLSGALRSLLPHSGTARLLTSILRSGPDAIDGIGHVPAAHPLAGGGRVPSFLGLELGAQAAAAFEALLRTNTIGDGAPRIGYLVRIREASFLEPHLPVETPLCVSARLEGTAPPLAVYRIRVGIGLVEYLRAIVSTHSGGE